MPPKSSDPVSIRSDIVLQGNEGNGAFGGKGKSIFDVERCGQVKYPKPLKQAKLSLDADSQKSATTREAPMSAKSKTARSQSGQVPSSVVGYVSADSKPALNKFVDAVLVKQAHLTCTRDGFSRLAASPEVKERTKRVVERLLSQDFAEVRFYLDRLDSLGEGYVTRDELQSALATRLLKLTTLEVVAIEEMLREIGLTKVDGRGELRMKISGFMNFFGGDSAKHKSQAYKHSMIDKDGKQIRKSLLLEPPTLDDRKKDFERIMSDPFQKQAETNRSQQSKMVFYGGFIFCPLWCLAWIWMNSKDLEARRQARYSVLLSCFGITVLTIIIALVIGTGQADQPPQQCESGVGLLISIKMTGEHASMADFTDYARQYQFKTALYNLYYSEAADKTGRPEDVVIVDYIKPLYGDAYGASLQIIFRLKMKPLENLNAEQIKFTDLVVEWVQNGELVNMLLSFGIKFKKIWLTPIIPYFATEAEIVTPRAFEVSPYRQTLLLQDRALEWGSKPYLFMQPPSSSSSIQADNPEAWKHHNETMLQTCWWLAKLIIPEDTCVGGQKTCLETGAAAIGTGGMVRALDAALRYTPEALGQRYIQVEVFSASTSDVLNVWTKRLPFADDKQTPPNPNWYSDESNRAKAENDVLRCTDLSDSYSCKKKYKLRFSQGPYKIWYQLGIVGKFHNSDTTAFTVRITYGNFNNETDTVGYVSGVDGGQKGNMEGGSSAAQGITPTNSFKLLYVCAMVLLICRHNVYTL